MHAFASLLHFCSQVSGFKGGGVSPGSPPSSPPDAPLFFPLPLPFPFPLPFPLPLTTVVWSYHNERSKIGRRQICNHDFVSCQPTTFHKHRGDPIHTSWNYEWHLHVCPRVPTMACQTLTPWPHCHPRTRKTCLSCRRTSRWALSIFSALRGLR